MNKKFSLIAFIAIFLGLGLTSCDMNSVTNLEISDTRITLLLGQNDSIIAEAKYTGDIVPALVWASSNPQVVSVSNGEIKALKKGMSVITVTAGTKSAKCEVTVTDEVKTQFTKGEIWYFGDAYETESSNNFLVVLATAGINLNDFSGVGEIVQLEFNSSLSNTTGIDNGTYKFVDSDANLFTPLTLIPGYSIESEDGDEFWGGWYFGAIESDLISGEVTVSRKVNNNYELNYEMLDGFGNKVSGVYNAPLFYIDATQFDVGQAAKMKKMQKGLKRKL